MLGVMIALPSMFVFRTSRLVNNRYPIDVIATTSNLITFVALKHSGQLPANLNILGMASAPAYISNNRLLVLI